MMNFDTFKELFINPRIDMNIECDIRMAYGMAHAYSLLCHDTESDKARECTNNIHDLLYPDLAEVK